MKSIKCKYCGKIYDSPSEMHKRKCHSHPDGAWAGYCTAGNVDEFTWSMEKHFEDQKKTLEEALNTNKVVSYLVRTLPKEEIKGEIVDDCYLSLPLLLDKKYTKEDTEPIKY